MGLESARRKMNAIGAGRQRDVGAIVDQEWRFEFGADLLERARSFEKRARRQ